VAILWHKSILVKVYRMDLKFSGSFFHRKRAIKFSGLVLLVLLFLSACSFSLAEDITPPPGAEIPFEEPTQPPLSGPLYPLVKPNPAAASATYAEKCAPCHGTMGLGDGSMAGQLPVPAPAIGTDQVSREAAPSEWYSIITQGNLERRMPPFNSLSDRQRWDVVAYLYSLSTTEQIIKEGEKLYQVNCAGCHGLAGNGKGPDIGDLSIAPTNFTDLELMAGRSDQQLFQSISEGKGADMPGYAEQLSPQEIWAISDYLRSLTFASQTTANTTLETPAPSMNEALVTETVSPTPESISGFGRVEGQVMSASGGEIPSGLTVTLYGFDQMQQVYSAETVVDAEGRYIFEEVPMPEGRAFLTSVEVDGVAYSSDIAVADVDTTSLTMMLPYYETTTDTAQLTVDRLHLLFEYIEPDTLRVVEMYIISNLGESVVVAADEGQPVLLYDLPEGAANLQFQDGMIGERYVEMDGGFGDLAVIRPGASQHQVIYSYDLPYKSALDFKHGVNLPVEAVIILIPEDGIRLDGEQLNNMGSRDVQGIPYLMYSSDSLEAGSDLHIEISGRPSSGGPLLSLGSNSSLTVGLLAFGVALIVAGGWLFLRSRNGKKNQHEAQVDDHLPAPGGDEDVDTLLDTILALDDRYKAGEIPKEAYLKRREELKASIKELVREREA
jgi:mono/diheme cytochrome c family protein